MSQMRWVLIAEDDDDIREIISQTLKEESDGLNIRVIEAKDGADALHHASGREFHCVITDLKMPRKNGEELMRALQNQPLNANTPMLIVSAHAQEEEIADKFSHVRIIPKPFVPQDLARAVVREIKLGRMDSRVAAHLMNPFLEATRHLLSEVVKLDVDMRPPAVKKVGDQLAGDIHCTLAITNGLSRTRFSLSFDRTLLDSVKSRYFAERHANWASFSTDTTARQLCQVIFEQVTPQLEKIMGGQVRLAGTSVVIAKSLETNHTVELEELNKSMGISVTMDTQNGRLIAGAYVKPKVPGVR